MAKKAPLTVSLKLDVDPDADDALVVIAGIVGASEGVESSLRRWVGIARTRRHTWQEIADSLGVTRQAAWERFKDVE